MKKVLYFMMAVFAVMSFIGCSAVQNAKSMAVNMGLSDYKFENVGQGSMRESMIDAEMKFISFGKDKTLVPAFISVLSQPRYTKYAEFFDQRCEAKGGQMTITGPVKESSVDFDGTHVTESRQTFPYNADDPNVRKILNIEKVGYSDKDPEKPFEVVMKCNDNQGVLFNALMRGGVAYGGFDDDSLTLEYLRYLPIMVTTREKQPDIFYPFPINKQLDGINNIDQFLSQKFTKMDLMPDNKKYWLYSKENGIYKAKNTYYRIFNNDDDDGRVGYVDIPDALEMIYDFYYIVETKDTPAEFITPYGDIKDMLKSYLWVKNGLMHREDFNGLYGVKGDPAWNITFKYEYEGKRKDHGLLTIKKGFDEARLAKQSVRPLDYSNFEKSEFIKYDNSDDVKTSKPQSKTSQSNKMQPVPNSVTSLNKKIARIAASDGYTEKINGTLFYQGIKTGEKEGCNTVGIIKKDGDDVRSKKNFKVCGNKVFPLEETTTEEINTSLRMLAPRVVMNCNLRGKASLSKGSYTVKCRQPNPNQAVFELYYLRNNLLIGYEIVK